MTQAKVLVLCTLLGCGAAVDGSDGGGQTSKDASVEPGLDAGTDAGIETQTDAGFDAGLVEQDAGIDAGFTDGGRDAGVDAGRPDAGVACTTPACKCGQNCLVPTNWEYAWRHGPSGWATTYVRDLGEEMSKKMYPPISNWNQMNAGYLSPNYAHYSVKNPAYDPPMYRRHVGWDNTRPDKTPVFSLTHGQVTFRQVVGTGYNNVLIIREKKNGVFQNRWWTYGHIVPGSGMAVGTQVTEGQQIGMVDQYNAIPHIHLSVHSTNWQKEILDSATPIKWGQHWGMARGITQELAESTAIEYTVNPIHAYALYKDYDVTP